MFHEMEIEVSEQQNQQHEKPDGNWQGAIIDVAAQAAQHFAHQEQREKHEATWRKVRRAIFMGLAVGGFLTYWMFVRSLAGSSVEGDPTTDAVALIPVQGEIANSTRASADKVLAMLDRACDNKKVKYIVLDIDSPGGSPTEAERMVSGLNQCRAKSGKPIYSIIGQIGASASYMVAVHTDRIYAGRYSVVGSIGAIMRYIDASEAASKLGLTEHVFRSGALKGGVSPWSKTSPEDAALNTELVRQMGQGFVDDVIATRGKRLHASRDVISSGRIWTSAEALDMGLIDGVAVLEDLKGTEFKGLKITKYDSRAPVSRYLGLDETFHSILSDALQPRFQ